MTTRRGDIAIIGISCEFPKANNLGAYWQNLCEGKECLTAFSDVELSNAGVSLDELRRDDYVKVGGILEEIEKFDAKFFGFSSREAELMDPQHKRLLEHAWWSLEDAGYNPFLTDKTIGIFAGASLNTYLIHNLLSHQDILQSDYAQQLLFGNSHDYLATRIAHQLNLTGPAITLQTACSTSLVLVHQAYQMLVSYQADLMLAGSVSISVPQKKGYLYSREGILSKDGHCRPFDREASGTIFTNGAAVVVLKRLQEALDDRDHIYAVIKSIALNNDGSDKLSYVAPSINGQAEVIALSHALADIDPETISYVETHGTATNIGDPVEIAALSKAFQSNKKQYCAIGSVKSNIGHLDVVAGLAGLIKVAMALKNKSLPPTINYSQVNTRLNLADSPFFVNTMLRQWQSHEAHPLRAGLSSFGIGGTNAHAILEEAPILTYPGKLTSSILIVISAKTQTALEKLCFQLADFLKTRDRINLLHLAFTLQVGRHVHSYRRALVVSNRDDLIQGLISPFTVTKCENVLSEVLLNGNISSKSQDELAEIARYWLEGHVIHWHKYYDHHDIARISLPPYPFERETCWIEPADCFHKSSPKKIANADEWFYLPSWKKSIHPQYVTKISMKNCLLFVNDDKFSQYFINHMKQHASFIIVYRDECYEQIDAKTFRINPRTYNHFEKMIHSLRENHHDVENIIYLWTYDQELPSVELGSFLERQELGLFGITRLVHAIEKSSSKLPMDITIIGNYFYNLSGDELCDPNKSTIIAVPKVFSKEYAKVTARVIDIGQPSYCAEYLDYLIRSILADIAQKSDQEEEIVYRVQNRWIREYSKILVPPIKDRPLSLQSDGVVLITGGLGEMGLDIADYFTRFGDLKLVLLTRSYFLAEEKWDEWISKHPDDHPVTQKIKRLRKLQSAGLTIKILKADVSDYQALLASINQIESEWKSIDIVIHAAGDTGNGIVAVQNPTDLSSYYPTSLAKINGTFNLTKIFSKRDIKTMILCSSMNAIIGGFGQIENTAVNIFLDQFSEYHSKNCHYNLLAINWGAVNLERSERVNVLPEFKALSTEHKTNYMNDFETHKIYDRILHYQFGPRLLISTVDMADVLTNWNRVASIEALSSSDAAVKETSSEKAVVTSLSDVSTYIGSCWQNILGTAFPKLSDNFFSLGGHSLAAVQVVNKIVNNYSIHLHVMEMYQLPEFGQFCDHIERKIQEKLSKTEMENFV